MRWFRPLAAVAAVVIIVGGIAGGVALVRSGDDDTGSLSNPPAPTSPTPTPHVSPSVSTSESPIPHTGGVITVPVYYLHDDGTNVRLYREFHRVPAVGDTLFDAMHEMFAGSPDDADYTSLWSAGTRATATSVVDGVIKVNLNDKAQGTFNGGSEAADLSVQQLVWTATAAYPDVSRVQILVDGQKVNDLFGTVDVSQPIARHAPSYEVVGAVWILSPTEGQTVSGPKVKLTGVATVYEATVSIDILKDGQRVKRTFATASAGAPETGAWSKIVKLTPGDYVVKAYESSAQDGHPTHIDTKSFTVS